MSIDQVKFFVLKSVSDSHGLKLFGNLFHKLPAWYVNDLRQKFVPNFDKTASSAVYLLMGVLPVRAEIHIQMLKLYGAI